MAIHDAMLFGDVAEGGFQEGIICLATIAICERANKPELIAALKENNAGYAAKILRDGALFRMHMYVVSAFDPVRDRFPDDINLRAAIQFIQSRPEELINEPQVDMNKLMEAVTLFNTASLDPALTGLVKIRNKAMAHRGVVEADFLAPMYGDVFAFTRTTCRIWELVALGSGMETVRMADVVARHERSAEVLWALLERT